MTLPQSRACASSMGVAWPVILSFGLDSILGLSSMLMVGRSRGRVGAVGLATQILGAVRAGTGGRHRHGRAGRRYIGANDRDRREC